MDNKTEKHSMYFEFSLKISLRSLREFHNHWDSRSIEIITGAIFYSKFTSIWICFVEELKWWMVMRRLRGLLETRRNIQVVLILRVHRKLVHRRMANLSVKLFGTLHDTALENNLYGHIIRRMSTMMHRSKVQDPDLNRLDLGALKDLGASKDLGWVTIAVFLTTLWTSSHVFSPAFALTMMQLFLRRSHRRYRHINGAVWSRRWIWKTVFLDQSKRYEIWNILFSFDFWLVFACSTESSCWFAFFFVCKSIINKN